MAAVNQKQTQTQPTHTAPANTQQQPAQPPKAGDPPAGHPLAGKNPQELIAHFGGISQAIRGLTAEGWSRSQVAKALDKRYQHVRNVLITPVTRPGQRGNQGTTEKPTEAQAAKSEEQQAAAAAMRK